MLLVLFSQLANNHCFFPGRTEEMLDSENQTRVEGLAGKISRLKGVFIQWYLQFKKLPVDTKCTLKVHLADCSSYILTQKYIIEGLTSNVRQIIPVIFASIAVIYKVIKAFCNIWRISKLSGANFPQENCKAIWEYFSFV